jgi:hypothetical protein
MKVLVFISLVGSLLLASCGGSSSKGNANAQEVNPADTIYLGDLREKFEGDSCSRSDVDGLPVFVGCNRIGSNRERLDKRIL